MIRFGYTSERKQLKYIFFSFFFSFPDSQNDKKEVSATDPHLSSLRTKITFTPSHNDNGLEYSCHALHPALTHSSEQLTARVTLDVHCKFFLLARLRETHSSAVSVFICSCFCLLESPVPPSVSPILCVSMARFRFLCCIDARYVFIFGVLSAFIIVILVVIGLRGIYVTPFSIDGPILCLRYVLFVFWKPRRVLRIPYNSTSSSLHLSGNLYHGCVFFPELPFVMSRPWIGLLTLPAAAITHRRRQKGKH